MRTMMTAFSFPLILFSFFCFLSTVPAARSETLSLATGTANQHTVVVYSAKPLKPTPAPTDLPLEIWLAANGLLSSYYPSTRPKQYATQSWPQTVVINGLTLEVNPGSMPTLKPVTTRETPASTMAPISTQHHEPEATSSATARRGDGDGDGDRIVGIIIGMGISFLALAMMLVIFGLMYRRKSSTGTFFKPARYSLSSVMTDTIRRRMVGDSWISPMGARQLEKENARQVEHYKDDFAPSPTIYRVSTIRAVDMSSPPESTCSNRASVERLRSRQLVSRGMWTEVKPYELHGDDALRAELSAESPTEKAAFRQTQSSGTLRQVFDDGEATPRARTDAGQRPLVVTMSPTTSSSGILESRDGNRTSSSGLGESRDMITPIVTPIPSYRDRRPADLLLPSATNRFRDQRLAPLVHFQDEHVSPRDISPLYRSPGISNSPSPNFRTNGFSPSPSPGAGYPERRVSPVVHYPSWREVRGFEFNDDGEASTPRVPSYTSLTDGGDGWQPGGDGIFGRYEMA